jgi:hypothetical protein
MEKINCEGYARVILEQFFPHLTEKERLYGWVQQDSVTAHSARVPTQDLDDIFVDLIISSDILPACSPS